MHSWHQKTPNSHGGATLYMNAAKVVKKFVPIVIVTHEATEGAVQTAIKESRRIRGLSRSPVHLRIESLG